jgi:hypothetical protein
VLRAPDYPFGLPQAIVDRFVDGVTETNAVEQGIDVLAMMNPSMAGDLAYRSCWDRAGRRGVSPALAQAMMRIQYNADVRALLPLVQVPNRWMEGKPPCSETTSVIRRLRARA